MQAPDMVQHRELWWRRDIVRLGVKREGTRTIMFVPTQPPDYTSYSSFLLSLTFCSQTKARVLFVRCFEKTATLVWACFTFLPEWREGGCIELEKNALEVASLFASLLAHYPWKRGFILEMGRYPFVWAQPQHLFCLFVFQLSTSIELDSLK